MTPQSFKLICFDLDDTLWPIAPVMQRADAAVMTWLHAQHPALARTVDSARLLQARRALAQLEPERAYDLTWLRTEALARIAEQSGFARSLGAEAFQVFSAERNRVELYDDVLPALSLLARRFRLATLSNGNADLQRIGLAPHFEFSLNAGGLGVAKPDARAFNAIAATAGCAVTDILYVGDDPHHDVLGARNAGLQTLWLRRDAARPWPADDAPPAWVLANLTELAQALNCASH